MKGLAPIILIVIGFFVIWTGVNGTTGTAIASLIIPEKVVLIDESSE